MFKWEQTTTVILLLVLFITISTSYAGLDDKSLVLYLSFDEGAGDTAKDSSVYGHDGDLIKNPTWVDGQFGRALEFDGAKAQYVIVPINDTLQLKEKFSIAFWVQRGDTQAATWNYMVAAGTLKWACIFNNATSNTYFWTSAPNWAQKAISDGPQPDDWVHLTVTHDIESEVVIYNNGKRAGGGVKPPTVAEIDGSIMVGARHPGQEYFTGIIDEVFIFNRIISEAEINSIIDGGFLSVEPAEKLTTTWAVIKDDRHQ